MNETNGNKRDNYRSESVRQTLYTLLGLAFIILAPIISLMTIMHNSLRDEMAIMREQMKVDKIELREQIKDVEVELREQIKDVKVELKEDIRVVQEDVFEMKLTLYRLVDDVEDMKQINQNHEDRITRLESSGATQEQASQEANTR